MKKTVIAGLISVGLTIASLSHAQVSEAVNNSDEVTAIITTFLLDETTTSGDIFNVTNGNDSGLGSLRQALSENVSNISIDSSVTTITIIETLEYNSADTVQIVGLGEGQTIDGSRLPEDSDILSINQGATFGIANLNFIGNIDEFNDDPNDPNNGTGIFVNVPNSRNGTVEVTLEDVSISNVGSHGVHVSDCTVRDQCAEGQGSPASVSLTANNVTIDSVGIGRQDGDGIRLDERGEGNVTFVVQDSRFINVGADGVELDEGDNGDITANIDNSVFDSNGEFCNFADEIEDTPCDNDGDPDLDDGFDIDETGSGSILVTITNSQFINNSDEGLDFDEEDDGNIEVTATDSLFQNNEDQGIRASEEGDGNVEASLTRITVGENNQEDEAIRVDEENDGDIIVEIVDSIVLDEDTDNEGLRMDESGSGSGTLEIRNSNFTEFDLDNVELNQS